MPPGMTLEQMLRVMGPQAAPEAPEAGEGAEVVEPVRPVVKRARVKGRFKADDPGTPDVDEAWQQES